MVYDHARQYYEQFGDLGVPRRYKTADGYSLSTWLQTQRKVYAGERYGSLSEERVEKLNALGMRWCSYLDEAWERYFRAAMRYYREHGDLDTPNTYVTPDGLRLGTWALKRRALHGTISRKQIERLDSIGMI